MPLSCLTFNTERTNAARWSESNEAITTAWEQNFLEPSFAIHCDRAERIRIAVWL